MSLSSESSSKSLYMFNIDFIPSSDADIVGKLKLFLSLLYLSVILRNLSSVIIYVINLSFVLRGSPECCKPSYLTTLIFFIAVKHKTNEPL